ncbi:unnamed protein product [Durusdinium trenchii]|uniref:AMP-binding enzyme C-terminal domain-containing protein n=1 Tax=Durusdinium trenchii TaxID=1381693 RepID=A0ABP0QHJ6_9DINO
MIKPRVPGGDLARVTRVKSKAEMQLLGRKDHQVKVRGQRIELGEVEHLLLQCAGALVTSVAVASFDDRLVAFCVPSDLLLTEMRESNVASVLRAVIRYLSEKEVPRGMRPRVVLTNSLPWTASGKVARGELRTLLTEESEDETPEMPLQGFSAEVAEIWAQELGQPVKRIKHHSHFQELLAFCEAQGICLYRKAFQGSLRFIPASWRSELLESSRRRDEKTQGVKELFEQYTKELRRGWVQSPVGTDEAEEPKSAEDLQKALQAAQQKLKEEQARNKGLEAELAATQRLLKVVAGLLGTTQGIPKEERANKFK